MGVSVPLNLWSADDRVAVFSIVAYSDVDTEYGLITEDARLIKAVTTAVLEGKEREPQREK